MDRSDGADAASSCLGDVGTKGQPAVPAAATALYVTWTNNANRQSSGTSSAIAEIVEPGIVPRECLSGRLLRSRSSACCRYDPHPPVDSLRCATGWSSHKSVVRFACNGRIFVAGTVEHAGTKIPPTNQTARSENSPSIKFVLVDLKIVGDFPDSDNVRAVILREWQDKEYNNVNELAEMVVGVGVRSYFQDRGYFKVLAHDPATQLLAVHDGKQQVLVSVAVTPGQQYRLGTLSFRTRAGHEPRIRATTLREQFKLRQDDVFSVAEVRAGLERVKELYKTHGFPEALLEPQFSFDDAAHRINLIVQIAEMPDKP
jgi:hypothetical protein